MFRRGAERCAFATRPTWEMAQETELHRGRRFVVRRGRRDGTSCIFKSPIAARSEEDAARLRHEHEVLLALDEPGVERPLALEQHAAGTTLVLEDAGPSSLAERLRAGPLPLAELLALAIEMARAVGAVHEHRLSHGDVCPGNFVLDPEGRTVTLVDFELAAEIGADSARLAAEGLMDATLAYVAPERTGRLSAPIDHRADLYSLGATFYEMLTGAPPFEASDPAALVHAHVAKAPAPPSERDPAIPRVLDDLVLKLLAKMPDLRYQSAGAVASDLSEAMRRLERTGRIEPFELGRFDASRALVGSGALYGRDREARALRDALARVREGGNELVLVTGPAGIGKSALVTQAFAGTPFVATGKLDSLRGDVPFAALREAFESLFERLERTPPALLERLRQRAREGLGPIVRTALELVPGLERLLGSRLAPHGEPAPSGGELHAGTVIRALVHSLAGPETPLVLFLDDLQWADSATIDLLRSLATARDLRYLLVVGAYRPAEVAGDHPLAGALDAIRAARTAVRRIELGPLEPQDVVRYCADLLGCSPGPVRPLAAYVAGKTGGNPLFVRRLLSRLHREQLVTVDAKDGACAFRLDRIARTDLPEDLLALMVESLAELPDEARRVVSVAACYPGRIELSALAAIAGIEEDEALAALEMPLHEGIVLREAAGATPSPAFRFVHDRVHQAAYASLTTSERHRIHLAIGRHGLAEISPDRDEPRLFEVVDALNRGADLVTDPAERLRMSALNRRAGEKAQRTLAFEAAGAYFRHALALLPPDAPRAHRAEWLDLVRAEVIAAFRSGDLAGAEASIDAVLPRLETPLEIAELLRIRVDGNVAYSRPAEAIAAGREALRQLGSPLPERLDEAAVQAELHAIERRLQALPRDALLTAPSLEEGPFEASMRILSSLFHPAWLRGENTLAAEAVARMVSITLDHGVGRESGPALAYFGIVYGAIAGGVDAGYEDARVGLALAHRAGDRRAECQARISVAYAMSPFRVPLRECIEELDAIAKLAWDSGDLLFYLYAQSWRAGTSLVAGFELPRLLPEIERSIALAESAELRHMELAFRLGRQLILCLQGKTSGRGRLEGEGFDAEAFAKEGGGAATIRDVYELEISYILRDFAAAASRAMAASSGPGVWPESLLLARATFYGALTAAAFAERAGPAQRQEILAPLAEAAERIRRWARRCPENFLHQELLVRGEIARIEGRIEEARDAFGRAIGAAARQGFLSDEALGHELAGRLEMNHGDAAEANLHIRRAISVFAHFGADEKARALAEEFPSAVPSPASYGALRAAGAEAPVSSTLLDVLSLVKFSEAIASEVVLERLVERLVTISLEAGGAERGALVLVDGGEPQVRAIGTSSGPATLTSTPLADSEDVPRGFVGQILGKSEAVVVDDVEGDPVLCADAYVKRVGVRCAMAVPIRGRSEIVGALYLENRLAAHTFAPDRVRLLQLLSTQIAISLENGLLFEKLRGEVEERRRAEQSVRFLADASVALAESMSAGKTLEAVVQLSVPFLADWCTLDLVSGGGRITRVASRHTDPAKDALLRELAERYPPEHDSQVIGMVALRAGEPRVLHDVPDSLLSAVLRDERHAEIVRTLGYVSTMAVPLVARGRRIGVITLYAAPGQRRYDASDVALVEDLARRAAVFIDSARLEAELRQSQKLEAIGRLAGGVAHDFNNLLTVVLSFADLLTKELPEGSRAAEWLEQIRAAGERAASLTHQLLAFGRSQVLTPTVLDLNEVVRSLEAMLRRLVGEDIEIELALGRVAHVRADVTQLEQVIVNLVANARDAMPEGGKITIETADATLDEPFGAPAKSYVRLSVRDTGVGMDPETRERIFEPFFSTKKVGQGVGLGLATVLGIVTQSEGRMAVRSEPGQGSTFDVYLPRSTAPAKRAEPAEKAERPSGRKATVLLVEDDAAVLRALCAALAGADFELLSATRGEEALRVAAEHEGPIDLLITDVIMPGMRGPELAARLREARPGIRVVFLSGHARELSERVMAPDATYIPKPVARDTLVRAVRDALARPAREER